MAILWINPSLQTSVLLLLCMILRAKACVTVFTSSEGEISSPNYPLNYPNSLNCTWVVNVTEDYVVELAFEAFEFEVSQNCSSDWLEINDAAAESNPTNSLLLPRTCGLGPAWPNYPFKVESVSNVMVISMITNDQISRRGFRASYRKVLPKEDFLIVADRSASQLAIVNRWNVQTKRIPLTEATELTALDYDPVERKIYYSEKDQSIIWRIDLNGTNQQKVITGVVADGLAVDPVSRLLYWTNVAKGTLSAFNLNGQTIHRVVKSMEGPRAIVVEPDRGLIYWTEWSGLPRIFQAHGDGANKKVLVNTDIKWPNGLALDRQNRILYWIEAYDDMEHIGRIYLNTYDADPTKEYLMRIEQGHPFALALDTNAIFWTSLDYGGIWFTSMDFDDDIKIYEVTGISYGMTRHITGNSISGENACSTGTNGGCLYLCLPKPNMERTCAKDDMSQQAILGLLFGVSIALAIVATLFGVVLSKVIRYFIQKSNLAQPSPHYEGGGHEDGIPPRGATTDDIGLVNFEIPSTNELPDTNSSDETQQWYDEEVRKSQYLEWT